MNPQAIVIIAVAAMVLVTIAFAAVVASRYTKAGPNQVLIVSGRKVQRPDGSCVGFRIVKGGGTFVFPIVEKADVLSLEMFTIEMPKTRVRTAQGGPAEVDCAAQVKIQGDDTSITAAAEHFLGKNAGDMKNIVRPLLEKHLRATLGDLSLAEMGQNLDTLANKVQTAAAPDLGKMGLGLVSFTIRDTRVG